MTSRSATPSQSGLTLIEVTLALALLGLGVLGVVHLFPRSLILNRRALDEDVATQFAATVLAGVRSQAARPGGFETLGTEPVALPEILSVTEPPAGVPLASLPWSDPSPGSSPRLLHVASATAPDAPMAGLRIRLTLRDPRRPQFPEGGGVEGWDDPAPPYLREVRLEIWRDRETPERDAPLRFITQVYRHEPAP